MTDTPYDAAMTRSKQELARQLVEAAARIEDMEAALKEAGEMWIRKDNRIEVLEAANSETAIKIAAMKTGIVIHRQDYGDFISDGPVNLSRFVRYLLAPEQDK